MATTVSVLELRPKPEWDKQIMLPEFYYSDPGTSNLDGDNFVQVQGSIKGDNIAYPNNTLTASCYRPEMRCSVATIEEIGPNHMGSIDLADYKVSLWNTAEVVAADKTRDDPYSCKITTLNIGRVQRSAYLVEQPLNVTKPICAKADTRTYKREIVSSIGWRALDAATKKEIH